MLTNIGNGEISFVNIIHNKIIPALRNIINLICVETARNESYIPIFRTAENCQIVIQANNNNGRNGSCLTWLATSLEEKRRQIKYCITSFFHKSHLWHVGHQMAVVLLYILHQTSVFEAIWQELP